MKYRQFFDDVQALLKQDDRLVADEQVLKNKAVELALQNDKDLIKLLLSNQKVKEKFFQKIDEITLFDKDLFIQFISNKNFLPDSYTAFKNKIGLVNSKDELISQTNDVVLNFPYKDCLLEGGQTKEDKKRKEVFFNTTLAHDEITCLLEPKVLGNFKRYTKDGEQEVKELKRDEKGNLQENFIFKGNNLLVLHSLKQQFAGKVKLIYIDPPYNTGNDSFGYNDNFNHSTWLVFIKNRLEVARELLREDGVIFVQCDDNEQAYLKVLMDEIFGRESFVANLVWKSKSGGANDSKHIAVDQEYICCYSKKADVLKFNLDLDGEVSTVYNLEDEKGKYALDRLDKQSLGYLKSLDFPILDKNGVEYRVEHKNDKEKIARWRWGKETVEKRYDELVFKNGKVYTKNYKKEGTIPRSLLVTERFSRTRTGKTEHYKLFEEYLFTSPKPENLLKFIIQISTQPNDLVLDFHLGSGTTCAVAHKMERQYIGVEQMDYVQDIAVERMKKVIDAEQGGISKAVDWQGGGEFIYAELAKVNQVWLEKIEKARSKEELEKLYDEIFAKAFLSFRVDNDKALIAKNKQEFRRQAIESQKISLAWLLDQNLVYLNKESLDDERFGVTNQDKKLNKQFYKGFDFSLEQEREEGGNE